MCLLHKCQIGSWPIKGFQICFRDLQAKNEAMDNKSVILRLNLKRECINFIELHEHFKLCFLVILIFMPLFFAQSWCYLLIIMKWDHLKLRARFHASIILLPLRGSRNVIRDPITASCHYFTWSDCCTFRNTQQSHWVGASSDLAILSETGSSPRDLARPLWSDS